MAKEFIFETTVYLGDVNIYGTTYFTRYFEWQGKAREEFFKGVIPDYNNFLKTGIIIKTVEASMEFKEETFLFDEIVINVKPGNVKMASYDLIFTFKNKKTGKIIGTGRQKIAFVNSSGKFIPIPMEIVENGRHYLEDPKDILKAELLLKTKRIFRR